MKNLSFPHIQAKSGPHPAAAMAPYAGSYVCYSAMEFMERRQDNVLCIAGPETAVVLLRPIRPALWIHSWLRRRGRKKTAEDEEQLNVDINICTPRREAALRRKSQNEG